MAVQNSNGIESIKEVSPSPAKYVFGHGAPDIFHVEVDKEYQALDEAGRVTSGKVLRWANVGEGQEHREEYLKREYYQRCTSPHVKAPFASNAGKDGTCNGEVPMIKRYGETYILMERDHEAAEAQYNFERGKSKERVKAANTTAGSEGIRPEWTLKPEKGGRKGR